MNMVSVMRHTALVLYVFMGLVCSLLGVDCAFADDVGETSASAASDYSEVLEDISGKIDGLPTSEELGLLRVGVK